ncbi:glycosyltransferase [Micromonospora yangpuensis]|uniref:Glycosyltransferase involved in cell wall bisynthesis n=1 Tax=Micromonospora yangpuensis TaxID=683228 RepID=A0A1C6U999_9ACTN|nr:glycosyltransferase [Micromonospora yangpuensis]GGL89097.1 glycosyl transferase [Micromonospora yangpuensis]SCL50429.1 Glycosyltransferase involved in cell wall bisynthesis [Micromonospora yangpuensis]
MTSTDRATPASSAEPAGASASAERAGGSPANSGTPLLAGRPVALVHEWFSAAGGSENVFLALGDLLPHADRYVLWAEPEVPRERLRLRESWLARTPLRRSKALALPFLPFAWHLGRPGGYEVVLSSSHAFGHTARFGPPEQTRHLSYVHSPARYLWSPDFDGRGAGRLLGGPRRVLRAADVRFSRHVHAYAANSVEVRDRIRRYWRRDAVVVHPPVDVDFFAAAPPAQRDQPRDHLLGVGRWIPYKNFDLMIAIAAEAGLPLVLAGGGPEEARLRRLAATVDVPVTFESRPDRARLRELYWGARALLFPAHEDFGIIPVEAQACGTPVVGLRAGGLLETVVDGETGFLVDSREPARHAAAVRRVGDLSADRVRRHATAFGADRFASRMAGWVADACR